MKEKCGKCKSSIIKGKCDCGWWWEKDEQPDALKTFERAILAYDHLREQDGTNSPLTMDHNTGNCMILFKGDYEMCVKVREFIDNYGCWSVADTLE